MNCWQTGIWEEADCLAGRPGPARAAQTETRLQTKPAEGLKNSEQQTPTGARETMRIETEARADAVRVWR